MAGLSTLFWKGSSDVAAKGALPSIIQMYEYKWKVKKISERKRPLEKCMHTWQDNILTVLRGIVCHGMDWLQELRYRFQLQAFMNT
jgi:hypothetical protein